MRGIFLLNSVKSFLNAEKYVIISKYYLGNIQLLNNSHIYSLYDELLDLKNDSKMTFMFENNNSGNLM